MVKLAEQQASPMERLEWLHVHSVKYAKKGFVFIRLIKQATKKL
jgi:hypothetical protein